MSDNVKLEKDIYDKAWFVVKIICVLIITGYVLLLLCVTSFVSLRPKVSEMWVMSRYEEVRAEMSKLKVVNEVTKIDMSSKGKQISPNTWFYPDDEHGVKLFIDKTGDWFVVVAPDGDGPLAYLVTREGRLYFTHDDAISVDMEWNSVIDPKHSLNSVSKKSKPNWREIFFDIYFDYGKMIRLDEN